MQNQEVSSRLSLTVMALFQGPKKEVYSVTYKGAPAPLFFAFVKNKDGVALHYSNDSYSVLGKALSTKPDITGAITYLCENYARFCTN
jgi:hypothetical protein